MTESITVWLDDQIGIAGQYLWLRKSDGTLLNTGGDALTDPDDTGLFSATLNESRTGLGTLRATITGSSDPTDAVAAGWLAESSALVVDDYPQSASGGSGDAEQATLLLVEDKVDSIAVALAGSSPVEPTGTTVFQHLEQIQDSIDTYVSSALATVNGTQDTIVGFPDSLTVGDSYTEDSGNAIHVFIRDGNDDPISSVGSHDFTDTDFAPELVITNSGNAGRVRATVTYVDPGSSEPYLKVEIPLAESRRAAPGSATMQCVLKWNGCAKTLATQSVTWVARI